MQLRRSRGAGCAGILGATGFHALPFTREITMFPMRFITKNPMDSPIAKCNKDLRCKINLFDDAVLSLSGATSYRDLATPRRSR